MLKIIPVFSPVLLDWPTPLCNTGCIAVRPWILTWGVAAMMSFRSRCRSRFSQGCLDHIHSRSLRLEPLEERILLDSAGSRILSHTPDGTFRLSSCCFGRSHPAATSWQSSSAAHPYGSSSQPFEVIESNDWLVGPIYDNPRRHDSMARPVLSLWA